MEDIRPFIKNMVKSVFKTRIENSEDISYPIVDAIDDVPERIAKPIIMSNIDMKKEIVSAVKELKDSYPKNPFDGISMLKGEKGEKGEKGDKGDMPSEEDVKRILVPFIPSPIPGKDGKDYVLTDKDKKSIANSIRVPVVEKVIETIIEKQPIVTNEIKEVALSDEPETIKEKLESLEGDDRLDAKAIKNLPKVSFGGGGIHDIKDAGDVLIGMPTNGQILSFDSAIGKWKPVSAGSGSGDMLKSVYDPTSVLGDAFSMDNMVETATKKVFTSTERTKLEGIATGAEVNVNADWNSVSGDSQILNKPTIPSVGGSDTQVQFNDGGSFGGDAGLTYNKTTNALTAGDVFVDDEAYDATNWNGSLEVPTKNAVRDKIEAMLSSSGITRAVTVTSGNYTAGSSASTDYIYLIAGAHTTTLPSASGNTNRYTFKNNHSAEVTINRAGTDTIDGATSVSLAPEESIDLISNGTDAWSII